MKSLLQSQPISHIELMSYILKASLLSQLVNSFLLKLSILVGPDRKQRAI